jgi:FdhE protein
MRESWERRIDRAALLAERGAAIRPLMLAYTHVLGLQRDCHATLPSSADRLSGRLERDLAALRRSVPPMLAAIADAGPPPLVDEARRLLASRDADIDALLMAAWRTAAGQDFFAKMILQPYAQYLTEADMRPADRGLPAGDSACPFCGGVPQLSILHSSGNGDGGGRQLLCATCLTRWPFRRIRCAFCGEEDERRLGYFHSEIFEHLRVDGCDTCRRYLKTVDLTRLGLAVPIVDEVAGASLDLWAVGQGYQKIELNLMGL